MSKYVILIGNGDYPFNEGNQYFERILSKHRAKYQEVSINKSQKERKSIVNDIIGEISKDGGNFLAPHAEFEDAWVEPDMKYIQSAINSKLRKCDKSEGRNDASESGDCNGMSTKKQSAEYKASSVALLPSAKNSNDGSDDSVNDNSDEQQEDSYHPNWLPLGWKYEQFSRSNLYYSPNCGYKFKSMMEVKRFLHCLEAVGSGDTNTNRKKGKEDLMREECDAYDLFRGSFSDEHWRERIRGISSGGARGKRKRKRRSNDLEGKDDMIDLGDSSPNNNRIANTDSSDSSSSSLPPQSGPSLSHGVKSKRVKGGSATKEVPMGSVGYTFRKQFIEGWFTGKVVEILSDAELGKDRRCLYEDGDAEDLSLEELEVLATLDTNDKSDGSLQESGKQIQPISNSSSSSKMPKLIKIPKPANGFEYTKIEALKIITGFPKKYQCVHSSDSKYSDGRERGKAIREMIAKGWIPISERNLYKHVANYEAGIPISTEWNSSTRWKEGDLVNGDGKLNQCSSDRKEESVDLPGDLDVYLELDRNKRWYEMFQRLKEFKRVHGTTVVLSSNAGADDKPLKEWAKYMRKDCRVFVSHAASNSVDAMRFALLKSIGFEYELIQRSTSPRKESNLSPIIKTNSTAEEDVSAPTPSSRSRKRPSPKCNATSSLDSNEYVPARSSKRACLSSGKETSLDNEMVLIDSLDDVPLCQTAESTIHSTSETGSIIDIVNEACNGNGGESNGRGEVEWLHNVASLLTTEKSAKGLKRNPSRAVSCTPPLDNSKRRLPVDGESKKLNLAERIFYWTCSCTKVNDYLSRHCSTCSKEKNPRSKRSLMLALAEKAVEEEEVQLVKQACQRVPIADRHAVPGEVIAYLIQEKIANEMFSTNCSAPSNDIDDYFYWICGSCTMRNSYTRANCTVCLQPKSSLADDSSLLAMARVVAEKSNSVEEAMNLIPKDERRAIPEVVLDGLVTCTAMIGKGKSRRRCKAPRCSGLAFCVSHCDPLLLQKSRKLSVNSSKETKQPQEGISRIIKNFPTFLSKIHGKLVNDYDWSVNCIEDAILCGEKMPFPLGLNVRKFFLGYGFHDGRIVKSVRKQLVEEGRQDQRPVLVYRVVYNDGDEEDFLHHEIASLRQVFDQANVSPEAPSSVQIPLGSRFEMKTGTKVTVVSHITSSEKGDQLVIQFDDSPEETEFDILKFQLVVVRRIDSSDSAPSNGKKCSAPLLEWPKLGRGLPDGTNEQDEYDIGEGLVLSRHVDKFAHKNDADACFSSSNAVNNPRDVRPGVKMRMWDPADCFRHLSYDPYFATVCEVCGLDDNANQLIICDKCECGFHTYCLRPVMVNIPKGDWFCPACSGSSNNVPFEEYKSGFEEVHVMRFLGLPFSKTSQFFDRNKEAINLFKKNSRNAIKQKAQSLQIPHEQVAFDVGSVQFIRVNESRDWRLPVPLLDKKELKRSLTTIVAALKYCGMNHYSADLTYPSAGDVTEEMANPDLDTDKIQPMSKRNMEIFKAFKHNIKQGIYPPIRVVYDENIGFNVEALASIQKYTLVGEYVGDVVTVDSSDNSNSDSLMLLLQTDDPKTSLIIDPTNSGNCSRFFSGINNGNLLSKRKANVRTRRFAMDGKIHVALFTSRDIEAGEILSYDYNAGNHGKRVEEWAKSGFYDTSNFF